MALKMALAIPSRAHRGGTDRIQSKDSHSSHENAEQLRGVETWSRHRWLAQHIRSNEVVRRLNVPEIETHALARSKLAGEITH